MRADRDQSYDQTEDMRRSGSVQGGEEKLETLECKEANRSQPHREAVSFNGRLIYSHSSTDQEAANPATVQSRLSFPRGGP